MAGLDLSVRGQVLSATAHRPLNGPVDPRIARALALLGAELQDEAAVEPLLRAMATTTDPDALFALAEGLKAVAGKLTEAQAAAAVELLLKTMAATTDPFALRTLGEGLGALSVKLTEAQAARGRAVAQGHGRDQRLGRALCPQRGACRNRATNPR